jgi:hypothetical protein
MRREPSRSLHNLLHRPEELLHGNRRSFWGLGVVSGAGHEGVTATFICANAQTYPFVGKLRPDRVAIRRDGSSQDSVEALANLRRAARDGGELRMIVWWSGGTTRS